MKNILIGVGFALGLLTGSTTTLLAQSADVTGGVMTITLDPTLWATLDTHGIVTTLGPVVANKSHSDAILSGIFDLPTGIGTFATKGQMKFTGPNGDVVTVLQMGLDTGGPVPVIYGYVYADDYYYHRQVIFNLITLTGSRPQLKMGVNKATTMLGTLSPYFLNLLGTSFHTPILVGYRGYTMLQMSIDLAPVQ